MRRVAEACQDEAVRFCGVADDATPDPRGIRICLRPYQNSLSLACRQAVRNASP